ncbi:hypothetical protein QTP86_018913, partial [Hemibagrus guttatus]
MWQDRLSLLLSIIVLVIGQGFQTSFRPQNCTLQCVCQGSPGCEYCRISKDDVETTLGFTSAGLFAGTLTLCFGPGCMPWLCHSFLGLQSPEVCQHYVHAPKNVTIEFVESQNPKYETVVVSWRPSQYGISFLRGFLVSLQPLGGTQTTCQLFLLQNNMSLSAVHAQRVYYSDPFTDLFLGTQYAVTVMALPVPEIWDKFYHSKLFFTRCMGSCTLLFTICLNAISNIEHVLKKMVWSTVKQIAADIVDAVRKPFFVQVQHKVKDITEEYYDEYTEHHFIPVANRTSTPRLLICYSSSDGSAHVRVVLQLATFVQKHMATE